MESEDFLLTIIFKHKSLPKSFPLLAPKLSCRVFSGDWGVVQGAALPGSTLARRSSPSPTQEGQKSFVTNKGKQGSALCSGSGQAGCFTCSASPSCLTQLQQCIHLHNQCNISVPSKRSPMEITVRGEQNSSSHPQGL